MSVTLHVRMLQPGKLDVLTQGTETTLYELLAVPELPRLQVAELFAGKRYRPSTDVLERIGNSNGILRRPPAGGHTASGARRRKGPERR